jgi:dsDNA-specific endonuclease/ATPase MutS2
LIFKIIQSYSFQLNQDKFPQLRLLIQKEKRLRQELKIEDLQYLDPKVKQKGSRKINELKNIQEEIYSLESTITHNLWGMIAKHASSIHQSLEILARLDTIFARALYALERGGTIPFMGIDGQIQVDNFIHPVLSSPLRRRGNQMSSTVVPIQLSLPRHHTTQRGLVITGSNGMSKNDS